MILIYGLYLIDTRNLTLCPDKINPKLQNKTNNYVPYGDMVKDQVGELCDR